MSNETLENDVCAAEIKPHHLKCQNWSGYDSDSSTGAGLTQTKNDRYGRTFGVLEIDKFDEKSLSSKRENKADRKLE